MEFKRDEISIGSVAGRVTPLPIFLNEENKFSTCVALLIVATLLYLSANHFPIFEPQRLHLSFVDKGMPFLPLTVWIYLSEYLYFFVLIFLAKDLRSLNKLIYAMCLLQFISCGIFWLWPTTYPRELFPLTSEIDPVTHFVFKYLREADSPNSCCPSLHVSSVVLCCLSYMEIKVPSRAIAVRNFSLISLWAIAIAVSTLTTKQHYLIDIISGSALAYAVYFIQFKLLSYRYLPSAAPEAEGVTLSELTR